MDDPGDNAGPAGLVAGPQSCPVVSMEVLVKQNVIAPVRIRLELLVGSVNRPTASLISQKDIREPASDLLGHLVKRHVPSRPGRALNLKIVAVVSVVLQQSSDD